jgi:hypothetical protein
MTVIKRMKICLVVSAICVASSAAVAKPPPGPIDPAIHEWFESLVRADGLHCCGAADCRIAAPGELRSGDNGFEILLNGKWQPIPEVMMVHRENAPFAATIICKSHDDMEIGDRLYCVVPYAGG